MLHLIGKSSTDYFVIECANCHSSVTVEYLGWDPAVPHVNATCQKCETSARFKLSGWDGLPPTPHKPR